MKLKALILNILIVLFISTVAAQTGSNEIIVKQGLVFKLPGNQRSLLAIDPIEQAMVLGTWTQPKDRDQIIVESDTAVWESIEADENGWFISPALRRGYLYVPFESETENVMLLKGMGNDLVYVNGTLRTGNRYGFTDEYSEWGPNFNYSILPIRLKAGTNHLLFFGTRSGRMKVKLQQPETTVFFNTNDMTLPDLIVGETFSTWGSVVVVNAGQQALNNFVIQAQVGDGKKVQTKMSVIQPMSVKKIAFQLEGIASAEPGMIDVQLELLTNEKVKASTAIQLRQVEPLRTYKRTFISNIDGSVQYYAINPAQDSNPDEPKAFILSVHGAGVFALNQANSYYGKTWAHIVAPTNRRPYGFNWEDWGRIDALEAMADARSELNIDPSRIYLTGHSMGGHGTWHLGVTYPDKFAAIGPSAGWISFWSYGVSNKIEEKTPMQKMLMRVTSPSNTMDLVENCKQHGIYILHGADDDNVPPEQARMMVERLEKFHHDFIYHEEPGQGHWWDISDERGADCVDWMPMMDFFARHARPGSERIRHIDFRTANPGISAQNNWLSIEAQIKHLELSHADIRFDPGVNRFVGNTENVARLSFILDEISDQDSVSIQLDDQNLGAVPVPTTDRRVWLSRENDRWQVINQPTARLKGPHRYGTFKDAFKNRVMFVYGTKGNKEENEWAFEKARYDAESFWYQGNGSIDIIADTEFDPKKDPDRNVILYGNAKTNAAWNVLLADSPVLVDNNTVTIGKKQIKGRDLAVLFIRPRMGSDIASVGVVTGTGIIGMRLTDRRPYLAPAYAIPDVTVFNPELLSDQDKGVKAAGFFGLDWGIETGEFVWNLEKK